MVGWRQLWTIDPRSLAAFRIAAAIVLLVDLGLRWPLIDVFYTNAGVQAGFSESYLTVGRARTTLLMGFGTPTHVRAFFTVSALVYLAFGLGLRTKLSHVLALVCATSIHVRSSVITYGGDVILQSFLLWTLFLPLGNVWSLDAAMSERPFQRTTRLVHSIAVFGLVLELALIYIFNAVDKNGATWWNGTAVHYALWLEPIALPAGVFIRTHAPSWLLTMATHGTRLVELFGGLALLVPWRVRWCRAVALTTLGLMHLSIFFTMNVGFLSPTMAAVFLLFITSEGWAGLRRRFGSTLPFLDVELASEPAARRPTAARIGVLVRELLAASHLYAAVVGAAAHNPGVPEAWRPPVPNWAYLWMVPINVFHGWGLFSPEPPKSSGWFVIEAKTIDGRIIDPITGEAPRTSFEPGFANDESPFIYNYRQSMRGFAKTRYADDIDIFIWRSHELPGRTPADRIVEYKAYDVGWRSPEPGSQTWGRRYRRVLLEGER